MGEIFLSALLASSLFTSCSVLLLPTVNGLGLLHPLNKLCLAATLLFFVEVF